MHPRGTFNPEEVTLCTTCMNRNTYLAQAIESWNFKQFHRIIIVDWSSATPVIETLSRFKNLKSVKVIRVEGQEVFHTPRARNLAVDFCETPYVWLVDSDVKLTYDPLKKFVSLNPKTFYRGSFFSTGAPTTGTCLLPTEAFAKVNGFSEHIETLPGEDLDLYKRLKRSGLREKLFPFGSLRHIYHPYELRYKYRPWNGMNRARATIVAHKREKWTSQHTRSREQYIAIDL